MADGRIVNFDVVDPFEEASRTESGSVQGLVHVRIQQRSGKKTLTTVQGLAEDTDPKVLIKAMRKALACNGCVVEHAEYGKVLQLQGDQRDAVGHFMIQSGLVVEKQLKIHGD